MRLRRLPLALSLAALGLGSATAQASVSVTTPNDGLTIDTACSLREAITLLDGDDATNYGCANIGADPTTINLPATFSPYRLTSHGTGNDTNVIGDLDVYRDMTIAGAGAASTVIDGDHADRVFDVFRFDAIPPHDQDPTVTISGVTITNGTAPSSGLVANGGGIEVFNSQASLTLNNDVVTANAAGSPPGAAGGKGGGIYTAGSLTLNSTSVDHNLAGPAGDGTHDGGSGGGIYAAVLVNIANSTVAANTAGNGGSTSGVGGSGGGIFASAAGATITASTISGNAAGTGNSTNGGSGGGILGGNLIVTNSTIANNDAGDSVGGPAGDGGGLFSVAGTLTNDTIVGNAAGTGIGGGSSNGVGGGIHSASDHFANTIIAANGLGGNCGTASFTDDGHNLTSGDATCAGLPLGDPNLGPLQDNGGSTKTMAISAPSAALDQVPSSGASCPAADQRGLARPQGSACDIGAFELLKQYTVSAAKTGSGSGSVASSPAAIDCGPTCTAQFDQGAEVTLTATADGASTFTGWSGGGCSGTGACTLTVGADATVTASFSAKPTLSVTKSGSGSGSVLSSPAAIDCGATCSAQFAPGSMVTLTANPAGGSTFAGWSGGGCSGTGPCTVTVSADTAVTGAFNQRAEGAPDTKISKAKIDSDAGTATFTFGTTAKARAASGFQCALVSKKHKKPKFKDCSSPKTYKHLKPGKYKFEVRAFDAAGADSSPAKKKFKIG